MIWIRNHWHINLARYEEWKRKKQALDEAHAERIDKEAKLKAEKALVEERQIQKEKEEILWDMKMAEATKHFLARYRSKEEISVFVKEVLDTDENFYVRKAWQTFGWDSSLVRNYAILHFSGNLPNELQERKG